MPDYPSIESKVEDATLAAFLEFGAASGFTFYTSNSGAEMSLPAVVIQCDSFAKLAPDAEAGARNNFDASVRVSVITNAEATTRAAHGVIYGLMQAIGIRSADQLPALMNAAGVADFTASEWAIEAGGSTDFDDDLRVSVLVFSLICSAS